MRAIIARGLSANQTRQINGLPASRSFGEGQVGGEARADEGPGSSDAPLERVGGGRRSDRRGPDAPTTPTTSAKRPGSHGPLIVGADVAGNGRCRTLVQNRSAP